MRGSHLPYHLVYKTHSCIRNTPGFGPIFCYQGSLKIQSIQTHVQGAPLLLMFNFGAKTCILYTRRYGSSSNLTGFCLRSGLETRKAEKCKPSSTPVPLAVHNMPGVWFPGMRFLNVAAACGASPEGWA